MRKITFYPKLAFSNLVRNRGTYLPYLLACITSIVTLYTMLAINSSGSLQNMRGASIVTSFTAIGSVITALFCAVLLFYTNSFLIKRRKKELGLYSILGMEKRNIAIVMFFETVFIAAIALVVGLLGGTLLAQGLFLVMLRLVQYPVALQLPVSFQSISLTVLFFGFVFFLTLLVNLRQVKIANPVELMAGSKQGEREPKASILLTIIGIVCLGVGYGLAIFIESPVEVFMIFLIAVALVIVGTYCLFTSGSIALLKLLRRKKSFYYTPRHFVPVSGMIYRMKQNAAGLASICILSCMVLVTVSSTVSLYAGAEDSLRTQYPYEYLVYMDDAQLGGEMVSKVEELAQQRNLEIEKMYDASYRGVIAQRENDQFKSTRNFGFGNMAYLEVMALEDYNMLQGTNETLGDKDALVYGFSNSFTEEQFVLDGVTYNVRTLERVQTEIPSNILADTYLLVLPNAAAIEQLVAAQPPQVWQEEEQNPLIRRDIGVDMVGSEADKQAFFSDLGTYIAQTEWTAGVRLQSRTTVEEEWYATNGGFLFLGIYFGVLFLLAAAMIIYYKQISEGYDDHDRYEVLQKVGMSGDEVRRTVGSQIRIVFFLPLVVATIHIAVAFLPISRAMLLFGVANTGLLILTTALTVLAYAVLYAFIYRKTAKTYYRIVRREA